MNENLKEMISKYGVKIHKDGVHLAMSQFVTKNPADKDYIISHKAEIMDYLKTEAEAKQKAAEERQAKIAAIEGLDLLEKTINAWAIHYAKSSAGQKALDSIINGANYKEAIASMETEWSEYCEAHIWD